MKEPTEQDQCKLSQLNIIDVADAYCERANMHMEDGAYPKAIRDYTTALWLYPQFATAYNNRAYAHIEVGKLKLALDDINAAMKLEHDSTFYNTRGKIYHKMGDFDKALADYKTAISIDPNYLNAYGGEVLARDDIRMEAQKMLTSVDIARIERLTMEDDDPRKWEWR